MKVIVVGASGTIGSAVAELLEPSHEVVRAGRHRGDVTLDSADSETIDAMYRQVGGFDALVCAAGGATFGVLSELSDEDFELGLRSKLMGQVNLVRISLGFVRSPGSFTLTSGILSRRPMPGSSAVTLAGAGLEGFVRAAALEMREGVRVNVVSPAWVKETMEAMGMDSTPGTPASKVALAY